MTTTALLRASSDSLLRLAMRADAVIVGVTGIALVAAAGPISSLTGIPTPVGYGVGAFSIGYGVVVFILAAAVVVRRAGLVTAIANAACTAVALAVVVTGVLPLTIAGVVVIVAAGLYTAVFAELQFAGVRRIPR